MIPLYVVGIGPGHRDHVTPAAWRAIEESALLVGGRRNLEAVALPGKRSLEITAGFETLIPAIAREAEEHRVAVVASGDPGLFGILKTLLRHFGRDQVVVVPGISSLQYLFARIALPWEDARIISLHGREVDFAVELAGVRKAALFTDALRDPGYIARELTACGMGGRTMYVGSHLSYEQESIVRDTVQALGARSGFDPFSVVVIIDE